MRSRRILSILGVVVALPILVPGSASAGFQGQPIFGDFNRDGFDDRVTLGAGTELGTCTVSVEYRRSDGTYRKPVTHTYTSIFPRQPFCPNMGEAINLGPRGQIELVLTHFLSSSASPQLMVLRNFEPVAGFEALGYPNFIGSADFNGDGRVDIWEWTDVSDRVKTFTNTPDGTLVPGAIDVCSRTGIKHVLSDFNGDGGQDFLIAISCVVEPNVDVRVLFGNGQAPVTLISRPNPASFDVFQVDLGLDRIPDAGVIEHTGDGLITHYFRNDGHGVFTEVS